MGVKVFVCWIILNCALGAKQRGLKYIKPDYATSMHPLDPLSESEIKITSETIKKYKPDIPWTFVWITLKEPLKSELLPYFLEDTEPPEGAIDRKSFTLIIDQTTGELFEVEVLLSKDGEKGTVSNFVKVPNDLAFIINMFGADKTETPAKLVLEDPLVKERLSQYGLHNLSLVVPDVWSIGYIEDRKDLQGKRLAQAYFYFRNSENDNYFAHPLGFIAVIDTMSKRVVELQELPNDSPLKSTSGMSDKPVENANYDPQVTPVVAYRNDISPITITQQGGTSFMVNGNLIKWQNFKMRIGFNGREGLVIYNVNYNDKGKVRPILYRAAVSEVLVPYGDPRPPYHRKTAFDAAEYGLGFTATELGPEVCKGVVHYFPVVTHGIDGAPNTMKNGICIYEEDAGILWRKKDGEGNKIVTSKSQRLVISFITVLSNYDYQFKWFFYQDASIRFETTLTGIVDSNFLREGETPAGHGNRISSRINAQFHQHFFVVRLDVEIDGNNNTVSTVDVHPDIDPPGSQNNLYGNGFSTTETVLKTASEGRSKQSASTARTWKVFGDPKNKNKVSGSTMGWKLISENTAPLMLPPESALHPKCAFLDYDVWVTQYQENQLYAGGFYLNKSGLPEWVARDPQATIQNQDIVLWHRIGVTHIPRVEDFPVMPTEDVGFWFKPANFFEKSPALDVKPFVRAEKS